MIHMNIGGVDLVEASLRGERLDVLPGSVWLFPQGKVSGIEEMALQKACCGDGDQTQGPDLEEQSEN